MIFSILAGREVDTWSEEWKHECEIAFLASMPLGKRNETLDGVTGSQDRDARGIKGIRGEAAVVHLRAEIDRYGALKRN